MMNETRAPDQKPQLPQYSIADVSAEHAARCTFYRLFSQVFRHPDDDIQQLIDQLIKTAAALPSLPPPPAMPALPLAELSQLYTQMFEAGGPRNALSLHESDFVSKTRATVWEDLVRFYEHFGLNYDGQCIRLYPDHVALELECLHYLTFLEAGLASQPGPLQRAQCDFIDRHLLSWLPQLSERLAQAPEAEFYSSLAGWLCLCLCADRAWLDSQATELH